MDRRQMAYDQQAKSKQEDSSNKSANLCSHSPTDDDTKDNLCTLQNSKLTPPAMIQEIATAGLSEMGTKDRGNRPDLNPPLAIKRDIPTPVMHAEVEPSSSLTETSQGTNLMLFTVKLDAEDLFDDAHFSDDTASDESACEGSDFVMDVDEIDEETDRAAPSDCCSEVCPEDDIKLEPGKLTYDQVQVPDGSCEGSHFKMEVDEIDEGTDSAVSDDDHSGACLKYDIKSEPRGLKGELESEDNESDSASFGDDESFEDDDDISQTKPVRDLKDSDWEPSMESSMSEYSLSDEDFLSDDDRTHSKKVNLPKKTQQPEIHPKKKYVKKQKDGNKIQKKKDNPGKKVKSSRLCSICGHKCISPFALEEHFRIHTGESPFLCNTCGSNFRSNRLLKQHMRTHSEQRYGCPECKKTYSSEAYLKKHQKCHKLEKLHVCLECGKSFLDLNHLKRHEIIHSGDLPYKCDTCGKGFNQASNLTVHLRTHTGVVPFTCSVCGKGFKHAFTLRNHKKKHDLPK